MSPGKRVLGNYIEIGIHEKYLLRGVNIEFVAFISLVAHVDSRKHLSIRLLICSLEATCRVATDKAVESNSADMVCRVDAT